MSTMSSRIRTLLRAAPHGLGMHSILAEVHDARPSTIYAMAKAGYLRREGEPRAYRYFIGETKYVIEPRTPEDKRLARRARERAAYHALPMEKRRTKRPGRVRKPAPKPKPKPAPVQIVIEPSRSRQAPTPVRVQRESVEAFLARGGRVQTLPGFTDVRPFLRRGEHA